jgi:phosphoglycolate phosphatase
MLSKPQTILFDWDNTLVDTWSPIHKAMNKTLEHYGFPLWELEAFKIHSHQSSKSLFPQIFKDQWQEAREFFYDQMSEEHLEKLAILPYAFELLSFLKEKQIPVGVISNKHRDLLTREIDHLGWQAFFQTIVGSGDTAQDKPHPEPILLALKNMALSPSSDHWYVGDTITDWQAAHASGCQPVALWTNPDASDIKVDFPIPFLESCHALYLKVSCF